MVREKTSRVSSLGSLAVDATLTGPCRKRGHGEDMSLGRQEGALLPGSHSCGCSTWWEIGEHHVGCGLCGEVRARRVRVIDAALLCASWLGSRRGVHDLLPGLYAARGGGSGGFVSGWMGLELRVRFCRPAAG